jgi:hypothetical protein
MKKSRWEFKRENFLLRLRTSKRKSRKFLLPILRFILFPIRHFEKELPKSLRISKGGIILFKNFHKTEGETNA